MREPDDPDVPFEAWPELRQRLRAAAQADARVEAPPRVEQELLQAYRRARAARAPLVRPATTLPLLGRRWRALAAAAAALVALAAVLAERRSPSGAELSAEAAAESPFLPLVESDSWDDVDAVQVVSVELPRSALASLGWNGSPDAAEPVTAEVLVGQDGLARGIRFVQ
jgi:hypothetical protein